MDIPPSTSLHLSPRQVASSLATLQALYLQHGSLEPFRLKNHTSAWCFKVGPRTRYILAQRGSKVWRPNHPPAALFEDAIAHPTTYSLLPGDHECELAGTTHLCLVRTGSKETLTLTVHGEHGDPHLQSEDEHHGQHETCSDTFALVRNGASANAATINMAKRTASSLQQDEESEGRSEKRQANRNSQAPQPDSSTLHPLDCLTWQFYKQIAFGTLEPASKGVLLAPYHLCSLLASGKPTFEVIDAYCDLIRIDLGELLSCTISILGPVRASDPTASGFGRCPAGSAVAEQTSTLSNDSAQTNFFLVLIAHKYHWSVLAIDISAKQIRYYDCQYASETADHTFKIGRALLAKVLDCPISIDAWSVATEEGFPQVSRSSDSGIVATQTIKQLISACIRPKHAERSDRCDWCFDHKSLERLRKLMYQELYNGRLALL